MELSARVRVREGVQETHHAVLELREGVRRVLLVGLLGAFPGSGLDGRGNASDGQRWGRCGQLLRHGLSGVCAGQEEMRWTGRSLRAVVRGLMRQEEACGSS